MNDVESLMALLAQPGTDFNQRDSEGQGFLHHAVLTATDLSVIKALVGKVDLSIRDNNCNTVMDLILSGPHPSGAKEAVEGRVRELIMQNGEVGEKETHRLLQSGWSHWPILSQKGNLKSEHAACLLEKLTALKVSLHSDTFSTNQFARGLCFPTSIYIMFVFLDHFVNVFFH